MLFFHGFEKTKILVGSGPPKLRDLAVLVSLPPSVLYFVRHQHTCVDQQHALQRLKPLSPRLCLFRRLRGQKLSQTNPFSKKKLTEKPGIYITYSCPSFSVPSFLFLLLVKQRKKTTTYTTPRVFFAKKKNKTLPKPSLPQRIRSSLQGLGIFLLRFLCQSLTLLGRFPPVKVWMNGEKSLGRHRWKTSQPWKK